MTYPSASSPDTPIFGNVASNAVDGDTGTWWQPVNGTAPATIIFDLGPGAGWYRSIRQRWYDNTYNANDYTVETSRTGTVWTTRATVTGNTLADRTDTFDHTSDRYVRVVVTAYRAQVAPDAALALREFNCTPSLATDLVATHYAFGDFPGGSSTTLDQSIARSFLASLPSVGQGTVTFMLDDAAGAAIAPGDLIAFDVLGVRAFVMICKSFERVAVDPGEEAALMLTRVGPGHLAVLKRGVLGPPGGVGRSPWTDDVIFDYVHPDYDDSGWSSATEFISVEDAKTSWPVLWADDMPAHAIAGVGSGTTMVVGPSSGTTTDAPVGDCFLRETFTTSFDGVHILFFTCDNTGEFWIDGKQITSAGTSGDPLESGFTHTSVQSVSLSAGEHVIAVKVTNWPSFGADNPIGVAAAIYVPGYPPTLVWESTAAMKITEYPSETPGMTPGTVMRLALEEQQAAGRLTFVDLDFDDDVDSDGASWPVFAEIASRVGVDLASFFGELASTYCDMEMDPTGWTLHAWVWGTKGGASGVVLEAATPGGDPSTGNLVSLRQRGEDTVADELLIRWAGGWSTNGSGDVQAFLELGPQVTSQEVGRLGDQQRAIFGDPREERAAQYEPRDDSEIPWVNAALVTGSTVTCPDSSDSPATDRVMELGCSESKDGERLQVTVTIKDVILQTQERFVQELKR